MMKISDPIIFGHVVRAFFPPTFAALRRHPGRRRPQPEQRPGRRSSPAWTSLPDGEAIRASFDAELAAGPALAMVDSDRGITNLHVPSDVIVDASMPAMIRTLGPHVGPRRRGGRHPGRHPRQQLRRRLPGGHRRLPGPRRLRPGHHGLGAQRRPDGPGRRGVRQPRQDLRDPRRRHGPGGRRRRRGRARAAGGRRRHLPHVPDQGRPHPRLGQARRHPGPGHRRPRGVLARRGPGPRRRADRQGPGVPGRARHRGPADRDHGARGGHGPLPGAHPSGREHHLGDRATCCATTSPTCSPSWSWGPAPRCSPSSP